METSILYKKTVGGATTVLNSSATNAVIAIGGTGMYIYKPTTMRDAHLYASTCSRVLQQFDNLGITHMAFAYFNTDILVNGSADASRLGANGVTRINIQIRAQTFLKSEVYSKSETTNLSTLSNYNANTQEQQHVFVLFANQEQKRITDLL